MRLPRARGVDGMAGKGVGKAIASCLVAVAVATLGVPVTSFAQGRYYEGRYRQPYHCEYQHHRRATYVRPMMYDRYRTRDSYDYERIHRHSKGRTALVIAG